MLCLRHRVHSGIRGICYTRVRVWKLVAFRRPDPEQRACGTCRIVCRLISAPCVLDRPVGGKNVIKVTAGRDCDRSHIFKDVSRAARRDIPHIKPARLYGSCFSDDIHVENDLGHIFVCCKRRARPAALPHDTVPSAVTRLPGQSELCSGPPGIPDALLSGRGPLDIPSVRTIEVLHCFPGVSFCKLITRPVSRFQGVGKITGSIVPCES